MRVFLFWGTSFHFFLLATSLPACLRYRKASAGRWRSDPYWSPSASRTRRTGPGCSLPKLWSRPTHLFIVLSDTPMRDRPRPRTKISSEASLERSAACRCSSLSSQRIKMSFTAVWDEVNAQWDVGVIFGLLGWKSRWSVTIVMSSFHFIALSIKKEHPRSPVVLWWLTAPNRFFPPL